MSSSVRAARILGLTAACAMLAVAACSDRGAESLTGLRGTANEEAGPNLDTQIHTTTTALFGTSARYVLAFWGRVKTEEMTHPGSRERFRELVSFIQRGTNHVTPGPGETREAAVARLVLLMSLYVYGGPASTPPVIVPGSEATLEVVQPSQTDTARTPSRQAAVVFPAGAVNEPTVVVITKEVLRYDQECTGPLPTTRCQYPQFYKFNVFPDVRLNTPATVSVCHVTTGDYRRPRADHDRFRIAHEKPLDPAAYIEGGTIEGDIEILPLADVGTLTSCEENDYAPTAFIPPDAGVFGRLAARARWQAGKVAHAVGRVLTPRSLYAIDRGGGGTVRIFSTFATIDPLSQADLAPEEGFSISAPAVTRGDAVTVNAWAIGNDGTGPAGAFSSSIVLSTSADLSEGTTLATLPVVPTLVPEALAAIAATSVTIPATTPAGAYYLGVRVDAAGAVAELDETNNVASVSITVRDPYTLFCPDGPEGSYSNFREAVTQTDAGGTIAICDGTWDIDAVLVDKPLTIRSLNPAGATVRNLTEGFGQGATPMFIVDGITEGLVRFADLGFAMRGRGILAQGTFDQLEVDNARFVNAAEAPFPSTTGIMIFDSPVASARVEVTNSSFSELSIGVFGVGQVETNVRRSTFTRFFGGAVIYSWSAATTSPSYGTTEDNVFIDCASSGCVRVLSAGNVVIARNRFESRDRVIALGAITVTPLTPIPHLPNIIEDNIIIGTAIPAFDPLTPGGWMIRDGINLSDNAGVANVIRRNRIENTHTALRMSGEATATDNTILGGAYAIQQTAARAVAFNRNDITGTLRWFSWNTGANYQCNWWGSNDAPPTGAVQPPATSASVYTPRATEPIANRPAVACSLSDLVPAPTQLFSFISSANSDVGGSLGTFFGGASLVNGQLALNGTAGYVQLDSRVIPTTGSFSVQFFASQAVRQNSYVEFLSQGVSGSGFYVGHDPNGTIRVSDAWQNTGVALPQDQVQHHYAVTHDAATSMTRLYIDGAEAATRVGTLTRGATGTNTRFGKQFEPFSENLNGYLDNIGVYSSVLSPTDVARLASGSGDLSCSTEVASSSGNASTIVFENRSGEPVKVEWIDFTGNRVVYVPSLANGAGYAQGTFLTHPWIITGLSTGRCYGVWLPVSQGRTVTIKPVTN